ncbi:MAG: dTDP-4-dehydrorhamnose reductase [Sulfurospirillaceae bacterium]|nr:dTDP-4-dehydrorhamnose reductase [Sulfurospirillaceae bacterium]MDD2826311.1 dTDP-4-dehydrorhamnose reductase [Sulfurospirillaceae bacterium]
MQTILVTGANGQLGQEIACLAPLYTEYLFIFPTKDMLDITEEKAIDTFLNQNKIDIIINCAAYTAVDNAETETTLADSINHYAVQTLALYAKNNAIKLIHISTDYVFNGQNFKPYTEEDMTAPQNSYGVSKLAGEKAMQAINPTNSLIIRTSWLYSGFGSNFVKTMLKLGHQKESLRVIYDQVGTPTYAADLAKTILDILPQINNKTIEIYHYSNEGVLSWYDFAKEIMKMAKLTCKVFPIETKDYPTAAKRPYYSILNKSKIKNDFKVDIPYWKDSLDACLRKLGERQ